MTCLSSNGCRQERLRRCVSLESLRCRARDDNGDGVDDDEEESGDGSVEETNGEEEENGGRIFLINHLARR